MPNLARIEKAIVVLESQRATLGHDVVDLSVETLQQQLNSLEAVQAVQQFDRVTVLVADLSDYTAMSERMDAEVVRDTINALWETLDQVVEAWGGEIDKHTGDGLIALFGLSGVQPDDQQRAILAALDLQVELDLFNNSSPNGRASRPRSHNELQMRIGIDSGPVLFGKVGMGGQNTAIGDAVRVASELQQLAPVGGVAVSQEIYAQVHTLFSLEALRLTTMNSDSGSQAVYLVNGEKRPESWSRSQREALSDSRLTGRHSELELLQLALQTCIDSGTAQFVTVIGEAGIGKSRLVSEFEQLLKLSPMRMSHFAARARRESGETPFALIRELFQNWFGIHPRSSAAVSREKFARGIRDAMQEDVATARARAHHIGQLLGFDFSSSPYWQEAGVDLVKMRERAIGDLVDFFKAVSTCSPVTVLLLEDLQWADERSLDAIEHIFVRCQDVPLLIICTGRPHVLERRPSWRALEKTYPSSYQNLALSPLSAIDSRHLIAEVLRGATQLPLKLVDLIVERTGGNPSYIEELTSMLVASGVVAKEGSQWRAQLGKLQGNQMLPTLTSLLQGRLDELSPVEKRALQAAAVLGRIFWSPALIQLLQSADNSLDESEIETALHALESQELVFRNRITAFKGVHEYVFRYTRLRHLAYESIPAHERKVYHIQSALWLECQSEARKGDYASLIAEHFERAEQVNRAAEWYGRAADHAREGHAMETAIQLYQRALALLPPESDGEDLTIRHSEALGGMLRWRARYEEAIDTYKTMQAAAQKAGDAAAEARALIGMFLTQDFQGDHLAAYTSSQKAESVARDAGSDELLSVAMVSRGWALARLDQMDEALALAREALAISTAASAQREIAFCNGLVGNICRIQRWYKQADRATRKALTIFRALEDRMWVALMLGNLGHIAFARHDYETATGYFEESLRIAQDIGEFYGAMRCLRKLGRISQIQGNLEAAAHFYQRAFVLSEKSGNHGYGAFIANELGTLYLRLAVPIFEEITDIEKDTYVQQAHIWLGRALRFAREVDIPHLIAAAKSGTACLLLAEGRPDEALAFAQESLSQALHLAQERPGKMIWKSAAAAWHALGRVATELPPESLPVTVADRKWDAPTCFDRATRLYERIRHGVEMEMAYTLYSWASFELEDGDQTRGATLWRQASELFSRIGMEREASRMQKSPS